MALIVIKLGTSTLTNGTKRISRRHMLGIIEQAAGLREKGHQVVIVSSGAIAAGRELLNYPELGRTVAAKQMLAAVGQGRLFQIFSELFSIFGITVGQVLLTRGDLNNRTGYLNARDTLLTLIGTGVVPVINENDTVATEEIRVGDNDNLSALVANLIDADLLILLTDQDGLYTADPRTDPTATLIPVVEQIDESIFRLAGGTSTGLGTGGMITKLQAAQLASRSGTTTVIANGKHPDVIQAVANGDPVGTLFKPQTTFVESFKRYLVSEKPHGVLRVDVGAVQQIREKGASLLPVGVRGVEQEFERGACVRVIGLDGSALAAGIVNYSSAELRRIIGQKSARIVELLGYSYGDEVIHRDYLSLL